jgi:CheY-like chemotaxis protein
MIDQIRVKQILINLVSNATKFCKNGDITITVNNDKNSKSLIFSVTDTGIGIDESRISQLFNPYEQCHVPSPQHEIGTGLGLSLCKKLVNTMGGDISAESKQNEGSTFKFSVLADPTTSSVPSPTNQLDGIGSSVSLEGLHVLVAEDNNVTRKIMKQTLLKMNINGTFVGNGQEAVRIVESGKIFDIILMDCQMPIMDGITAAKTIREMKGDQSPVIVALTANVLVENKDECLIYMDDFLSKPVRRNQLKSMLCKWVMKKCNTPDSITHRLRFDDESSSNISLVPHSLSTHYNNPTSVSSLGGHRRSSSIV